MTNDLHQAVHYLISPGKTLNLSKTEASFNGHVIDAINALIRAHNSVNDVQRRDALKSATTFINHAGYYIGN